MKLVKKDIKAPLGSAILLIGLYVLSACTEEGLFDPNALSSEKTAAKTTAENQALNPETTTDGDESSTSTTTTEDSSTVVSSDTSTSTSSDISTIVSKAVITKAKEVVAEEEESDDSSNVLVDNIPPTFTALSINSGATATRTTTVTLNLTAQDAVSMYITNTANCGAGGSYETFASTKSWTLGQTNGTATVYAKVKDSANNESECKQATIVHDGNEPTLTGALSYGLDSWLMTASPTITWSAGSDVGLGLKSYWLAIGTGAGLTDVKDWTNVGTVTSYSFSGLSLTYGSNYYVSLFALDNAENQSDILEGGSFFAGNLITNVYAGTNAATCAVLARGGVKCVGNNGSGILGLGHTNAMGDSADEIGTSLPMVDVGTGLTVTGGAHGWDFACFMFSNNKIKCVGGPTATGSESTATLGDSSSEMGDNLPFVNLGTNRTVKKLTAHWHHACAILDNDTLKCWGTNGNGNLGIGDTATRGDGSGEMGDNLPTVSLGTGLTPSDVKAGKNHTCALFTNGKVKCWGHGGYGQLGYGDITTRGDGAGEMGDSLPFVDLGTGKTATQISAGWDHTCALLNDGTLKCWGRNVAGVLGLGLADTAVIGDGASEMGDSLSTVDFGSGLTVSKLRSNALTNCLVFSNNTVKCWGSGADGQNGNGSTANIGDSSSEMGSNLTAISLGTGYTVKEVAVGYRHVCAILSNDRLKCWGNGTYGELGYGDTSHRGDGAGEMGDNLPFVSL